jgi:DNA-binding response OmpR family regulator
MSKPFDLPELVARIRVMLRRTRAEEQRAKPLRFEHVTINLSERSVRVRGKSIDLSAREFDLLVLLAASPGRVFSREAILEQVWGWDYEGTARTVDNFVASLRKKLRVPRHTTAYIKTVPRVGYKFELPPGQ